MRLLVTGSTGLLGPYLLAEAQRQGIATGAARSGADFNVDLEDAEKTREAVDTFQPDVVLHAAAMTNVDRCEADPDAAKRANALATHNLVAAMKHSARLVFISTDQIYPDRPGLKHENEEGPVNAYGCSKLAGERIALTRTNSLILRCNMFGPSLTPGRSSFSDWIIDSLRRRSPVTLFTDVLFSPLLFSTLSAVTLDCVARGIHGTFNLGSRNGTSKRNFAVMIARHLGLPLDCTRDGLSSEVATRAPRPLDLRLDVTRLEAALGRPMPTLQEEVLRL
jgi:dTDP-4-dehydrorhamnose reductase